ncbi:DNA repair protein RecN [Brassicibacter mesophilus]|uniref:DNA repair protein RecN n=1 Tax=Brassicibacter mesophilus TaxID=745119 RepID=UPI003D2204A9
MLLELNIENFAIIDKLRISFTKGLNILTGETGTGKSIIIDAISLVLGGRATREYIRSGSDRTVIEALFSINSPEIMLSVLGNFGIDYEKDDTLLITREIHNTGRSTSRVNGRTVTLSMLNDITNKLIDIHGQHEHQSLLFSERHIDFIDCLGKDDVIIIKEKVKEEYSKLSFLRNKLKQISNNEMEKERKLDLLKFQLSEINEASLKVSEEEEISNQFKILSNVEIISNSLKTVIENLSSSDYNTKPVIDQLNSMYIILQKLGKHDERLSTFAASIESTVYQLQDIVRELRYYEEGIEYDPERLKFLEDRMDLINRLKRKYGKTIQEILEYRENIFNELAILMNCEEEIKSIKSQIRSIEAVLEDCCDRLSKERKNISSLVERAITKELKELNMGNVSFKVKIDKLDYFTQNGNDKIEFLISTNPGEPLKSLSKVVSGGEMSRIMLAFKNILAEVDNIPTLIFDEIDTGISGRTAQIVGEKISKISNTHQVICITHLPQIAAMADSHFMINKIIHENITKTEIKRLQYDERVEELSRLLGGVSLTNTTKKHANEMLEMSKKIKSNYLKHL